MTAQSYYRNLVEDFADREPRFGYHLGTLPELNFDEVAAISEANPEVAGDIVISPSALLMLLRDAKDDAVAANARFAHYVKEQAVHLARKVILVDIREESLNREEAAADQDIDLEAR